ncbi:MAG: metallophosphoesterase [Bacteroidales bacterium]|jgi:hypothetical protein|nr:metallophosphoesterase [Bacteroidales bacterium]
MSACEKIDLKGMFVSYEYVNERFEQSMEWNTIHPYKEIAVSENSYKVFAMSDSHIGGVINFNLFVNDALNANACALIMDGDITTGRDYDYNTLQQNIPKSDTIASFLTVGNHDLYFNGWNEFFPRFGASVYYFSVRTPEAADLYISLDSGSGTLGSKQLEWLKNILENERPKYRHCIIFTHVDFFRYRHTSSTNPVVEELYILMDLFVKNNVNMLITGHDHQKDVEIFGNTAYITLDALLDGYNQAGYLQLSVTNNNVDYTFVNF